jgi:hypothetical protein
MAGKTPITITVDPCRFLFLCQKWMTEQARHLLFSQSMHFPAFMTSATGPTIGPE